MQMPANREYLAGLNDRELRSHLFWTAVEIVKRNSNDEAAYIFEDEISEAFMVFDEEDQPIIRIEWG